MDELKTTGKEVVNKSTGEITNSQPQQLQTTEVVDREKARQEWEMNTQEEMKKLIPTAGTIELSEEQKEILYAPVNEEDIEIRPDGLIYLPWVEYVARLKQTFGLQWSLVPQGPPRVFGSHIVWGFYLMIQGKLAGFAIGEQEYFPGNKKMSWSDACEGAKSNALMRLCKGLGISSELWRPSFINEWIKNNAEEGWETNYKGEKKKKWRKKTKQPNQEETATPKKVLPKKEEFCDVQVAETPSQERARIEAKIKKVFPDEETRQPQETSAVSTPDARMVRRKIDHLVEKIPFNDHAQLYKRLFGTKQNLTLLELTNYMKELEKLSISLMDQEHGVVKELTQEEFLEGE